MKISTFAIILAILGAFYGLALLAIPVKFLANYGIVLDNGGVTVARLLGAILFGNSIIYWLFRNVPASDKTWRYILTGTIIYSAISIPISATSALTGITNSMGWTTVAVQFLVTVTCAYYLVQRTTQAKVA
jgi:hypothetical protein